MTEPTMNDAKLDQALGALSRLEARLEIDLGALKQDVGVLKQDVGVLKQDVGVLKQDVGVLKQDVGVLKQDFSGVKQDLGGMKAQQAEMVAAFRAHWADTSNLYRTLREDFKKLEVWVEGKFTQLHQGIVALKDSIEHQDYRHDELGRRLTNLEMRDKPPY